MAHIDSAIALLVTTVVCGYALIEARQDRGGEPERENGGEQSAGQCVLHGEEITRSERPWRGGYYFRHNVGAGILQ